MITIRFRVSSIWLVFGSVGITCGVIACDPGPRSSESVARFPLIDIGVEAEIGVQDSGDPLAVLHRPMDATFVDGEIAVLDASPPWIRVFARDGRFLRAMMRKGQGPGEAELPYTLRSTRDGGFVVGSARGIERVDRDGNHLLAIRGGDYWIYAAVEACEGNIHALARRTGEIGALSLFMRLGQDSTLADTLAVFGAMRLPAQLRRRHSSYVRPVPGGVLLYPEELDRHRILEVDCNGGVLRDLEVESLGNPERVGLPPTPEQNPGRVAVRAAEPPYPGGLTRIGTTVLWAALTVDSLTNGTVDSTTVLTAFDREDRALQISIDGWYQIFDSDAEGSLLLGNADATYPSVIVVDGHTVLRLIDEQGKPPADRQPD
jgi:hypothetical protein